MQSLLEIGVSNAVAAAVLGAVVTVVTRLWRRPALASALWLLVLVKLVTPPIPWALVPRPAEPRPQVAVKHVVKSGRSVAASGPARRRVAQSARSAERQKTTPRANNRPVLNTQATPGWTKVAEACRSWLPPVWAVGGLLWFGLASIRLRRFGRLLRHAQPAPEVLCLKARALARRMGLRSCPELRVTEATVPPLVWIVTRRPIIALPATLLRQLSCQQQETLVAHELAHLRRRDHWTAWLELVVLGLYWWHPMVWWARRELHRAQEACCDGWVIWALPEAALAYAKTLLDTVDFLSDLRPVVPPAASAFGEAHSLRRRLEMILHERIAHRLSWPVGLGLLLTALPMVLWAPALRPAKADVDANQGQSAASIDEMQQRISRLEQTVAVLLNELRELRETLEPGREQALTNAEVEPIQELATEEQMQPEGEEQDAGNDETPPDLDSEETEAMEPEEPEHEAVESNEEDEANHEVELEDGSDDDRNEQAIETSEENPQPRLAELIREHRRLRQRLMEIEDELEEELGRRLDR